MCKIEVPDWNTWYNVHIIDSDNDNGKYKEKLHKISHKGNVNKEEDKIIIGDTGDSIVYNKFIWNNINELKAYLRQSKEIGRLRYRRNNLFKNLPGKFGLGFSTYYEILGKKDKKILANLVKNVDGTTEQIKDWLKELSAYAKTQGKNSVFGSSWFKFVDLNLLNGYTTPGDREQPVIEQAKNWLSGVAHIEQSPEYNGFVSFLRKYVKQWLSRSNNNTFYEFSEIDDFLKDPVRWATAGVTLQATEHSKDLELKRSKWNLALMNLDNLRGYAGMNRKQMKTLLRKPSWTVRVLDKFETGKVRQISVADEKMQIRMAWFHQYLVLLLKNHKQCPPLMDLKSMVQLIHKMIPTGTFIEQPIDVGGFDTNVSLEMVSIVAEQMCEFVIEHINFKNDTQMAFANTLKNIISKSLLDGAKIEVINEDTTKSYFKQTKGLVSGILWTNIIGSIISAAYFEFNSGNTNTLLASAGDDVAGHGRSWLETGKTLANYNKLKVDVNPKKFSLSMDRIEFLRMSINEDGVYGYPARAVGSINWAKPWGENDMTLRNQFETICSGWVRACRRALVKTGNGIYRDVAAHLKVSIDDAREMVHAAKHNGGYGLLPINNTVITWDRQYDEDEGGDSTYSDMGLFKGTKGWMRWLAPKLKAIGPTEEKETINIARNIANKIKIPNEAYMGQWGRQSTNAVWEIPPGRNQTIFEVELQEILREKPIRLEAIWNLCSKYNVECEKAKILQVYRRSSSRVFKMWAFAGLPNYTVVSDTYGENPIAVAASEILRNCYGWLFATKKHVTMKHIIGLLNSINNNLVISKARALMGGARYSF